MRQAALFNIPVRPEDIVYTPDRIAAGIVRWLNPKGVCLDPCKGDGAFYNHFPEGREYCEIREGLDFFDYHKKVDWVIGNPPYSIFETFLQKSFMIADNVAFLVPTNKVFQRQIIMDRINNWGGVKGYNNLWLRSTARLSFWVFSRAFSFQKRLQGRNKNYHGHKIN